jgi:hypothetical protein
MENQTAVRPSERTQVGPILVAVLGMPVAGIQALTGLGHFLALWLVGDALRENGFDAPETTTSDWLRATGYASVNVAVAVVCVVAIIVALRPSRRGSVVPWVCLGFVAVAALLTFTGWTYFGETV